MSSNPSGLLNTKEQIDQIDQDHQHQELIKLKIMKPQSVAASQTNLSQTANKRSSKEYKIAVVDQTETTGGLSGSETDISTSTENLSMEQRYVLKHTSRVEPQGQENLPPSVPVTNENQTITGRHSTEPRYSSNISNESLRYNTANRSISEARNVIFSQSPNSTTNRNSIKETVGNSSNRSSMDASTCSYNTIIIHNEDNTYTMSGATDSRDLGDSHMKRGDRPRSYGEMQDISEIPDDYLNDSQVLKHLAKEMKMPMGRRSQNSWGSNSSNNKYDVNDICKFEEFTDDESESKSLKAQPESQGELKKLDSTSDLDKLEAVSKENEILKQQLQSSCLKLARTQKLEEEVMNIHRVHSELVESCDKRAKLETAARMRLQSDLLRVQELNRNLKDQLEILQSQLTTPTEHQNLIAQLFTQNKELMAAKDRQGIELIAQRDTLEEQRKHIGILNTALTKAQANICRLEEELRRRQQPSMERYLQMQNNAKQAERTKLMLDYDGELGKDSNRSGSSSHSTEGKWSQLSNKNQLMILENDAKRQQNSSKLSSIGSISDTDRIIAEDKIRCIEEVQAVNQKLNDLQLHMKTLESRLAEKDALIQSLQEKKICESSYDSYNLGGDGYGINHNTLGGYNSQASFNVSNASFNLLSNNQYNDHGFGSQNSSGTSFTPSLNTTSYGANANSYGKTTPTYNKSIGNLQSIVGPGHYSGNSSNYETTSYMDPSYESSTRKSFEELMNHHQYDDHLMNKRGLCCFPSLSNKKTNQSLLSDQISVLSTNNSDAFLQKLAQIDQRRERERHRNDHDNGINNATKTEDIVLLEKQGICSQKMRSNTPNLGNLVEVSQSVGHNMTDISNIGHVKSSNNLMANITQNINNIANSAGFLGGPRKDRGGSLPPSALPRPPRLKPPRKIDYDRLSDSDVKKSNSHTPPKISPQRNAHIRGNSLKRGDFMKRDFSPGKKYLDIRDAMAIKKSDYGSIETTDINQNQANYGDNYARSYYPNTKHYQRLHESSGKNDEGSLTLKRSLLPSRKVTSTGIPKSTAGSYSANNFGQNSNGMVNQQSTRKASPKYMHLLPIGGPQRSHMDIQMVPLVSVSQQNSDQTSALPPKPIESQKSSGSSDGRGNTNRQTNPSYHRGENRYRIQF